MLNTFAEILVLVGACGLAHALILVRQLIEQLPEGSVQHRWNVLKNFIVLFIVSYLLYGVTQWGQEMIGVDLIVPGIFLFGSIFVWLTVNLSLQTAADLRRVVLLEHENITDPLMGIFNRRYLDRRLEDEYNRSLRYESPLSILLIDVDHFKVINDSYGHQVGDYVLNCLGVLLLQIIRPTDIAARYGGEEIMLISPNTPISSATVLAERIRKNIETHEFMVKDDSSQPNKIHITVSIGLACRDPEDTDSQSLVQNADQALYRAKQTGRNRTTVHDSMC